MENVETCMETPYRKHERLLLVSSLILNKLRNKANETKGNIITYSYCGQLVYKNSMPPRVERLIFCVVSKDISACLWKRIKGVQPRLKQNVNIQNKSWGTRESLWWFQSSFTHRGGNNLNLFRGTLKITCNTEWKFLLEKLVVLKSVNHPSE